MFKNINKYNQNINKYAEQSFSVCLFYPVAQTGGLGVRTPSPEMTSFVKFLKVLKII